MPVKVFNVFVFLAVTIYEVLFSLINSYIFRPIYRDLGTWTGARSKAIENFGTHKNKMMQVCRNNIEKDLEVK